MEKKNRERRQEKVGQSGIHRRFWMGIEGMDGLLLLFTVLACAARGHLWVRFPTTLFAPFKKINVLSQYFFGCRRIFCSFSMTAHCIWDPYGGFG